MLHLHLRPGHHRLLATIGCGTLGAVIALLGTTAARWADTRWVSGPGTVALGPWRAGMTLRETFDGFPAPAARGARSTTPRLRLLADNPTAWVERWRLIAAARDRIDVTSFIVHDDLYGRAFFGLLLEKARQGVAVRLLVDGFGTDLDRSLTDEDYLDELVSAGIQIRVYRPLAVRITQAIAHLDPIAAVASEHDKLILVDGERAIIGGRNIGAEYFAAHARAPHAFHDVDVAIEDPAVTRALVGAFAAGWRNEASDQVEGETIDLVSSKDPLLGAYRAMDATLRGQEGTIPQEDALAQEALAELREDEPELHGALGASSRPGEAPVTRPPPFPGEVRLLDSGPRDDDPHDPITEALRRLLSSARREVLIETPYLVLSREVVQVFTEAAERGVRVTIVTNSPSSSDNAVSQAFLLEQWPEVLARVPTLRLFARGDGHNLHAKTAVFDRQLSVVSTYNLDPVSMAIQGEVAVVIWSAPFAEQVAGPATSMIEEGPPTTYEYRIARDASGVARRGPDGRPVVLFGPQQHTDPTRWRALTAWWQTLRALRSVGFDPIF